MVVITIIMIYEVKLYPQGKSPWYPLNMRLGRIPGMVRALWRGEQPLAPATN
jgi:hypothetical protein